MKIDPHELPDEFLAARIVRPTPDREILGIFAGDAPLFCRQHFYGGRTVPCLGDNGCDPCRLGYEWRYSCYSWFQPDDRLCWRILCVPYTGCLAMRDILTANNGTIHGVPFICTRHGKSIRSAVRIAVSRDRPWSNKTISPPSPLLARLEKIWGMTLS